MALKIAGSTLIVLLAVLIGLTSCSHRKPASEVTSPVSGPLRTGPDSPNWVSTTAEPTDKEHYIAPFAASTNPIPLLMDMLHDNMLLPRIHVERATEYYLHATATSKVFRFVDDLEFLYDPHTRLLHVRSASRVGFSDFGVNRKRMNKILRLLGTRM